ncbi:hypothetical protein [Streptomyces luteolus]|uniref:Integral membrane protein n=1 Tax=Streptomyces luteolus TaxID=3043615 RepID=A0ABT6T2X2_9ACTN|nr:hypothetical protein [Streptomyces sp. B-S-A12]MDI3421985.1 hypothetical protein [Streptomyces sp. B-S-A12]
MSAATAQPGLLLFGRRAGSVLLALLLLVAGVWTSWSTAQHVVFMEDREQGTMTVVRCSGEACSGSFAPVDPEGEPRDAVVIDRSIGEHKGARVPVAVKPGTDEVVRTGGPGFLHAWVPLGGALLLAAVVLGGGLRSARLAWGVGLTGGVLLVASFATL